MSLVFCLSPDLGLDLDLDQAEQKLTTFPCFRALSGKRHMEQNDLQGLFYKLKDLSVNFCVTILVERFTFQDCSTIH